MAAKIHLEIVTPEGVKFSEEVEGFTAPGVQGEFGVLPSHRPLLAGLKTGIVSYEQEKEHFQIAIGPGFARVAADRANIVTDHFMQKQDVDPVIARKELKDAQDALDVLEGGATESSGAELIAASRWAAVRLELYGDAPPATVVMEHEMRLLGHGEYSKQSMSDEDTEGENST